MTSLNRNLKLENNGFEVVNNIYNKLEIKNILNIIDKADTTKTTFRKSDDLFAIRQFLKEVPDVIKLIFNDQLKTLLINNFGHNYFLVKSIYFDKPGTSNWFVSYHQDLTISVDKKVELEGFGPYTNKHNQFAVQPPLSILLSNFTVRIHLDDTNEKNGALNIIPNSHNKGIYRAQSIDWSKENQLTCNVKAGGIMIMKPLLLHSSNRTINSKKRRVIHLEFSNQELPKELEWSEYLNYN